MNCRSILIVEDDPFIREVLQEALSAEGYEVHTASNGRAAMESLGAIERPCLILLDLMMPVMSGWEFLTVQKNNLMLATIPVVVVSAATDAARAPGASGYIKKPVDLDRLISTVERYCGKPSDLPLDRAS